MQPQIRAKYAHLLSLPSHVKAAVMNAARVKRLRELNAPAPVLETDEALLKKKLDKLTDGERATVDGFVEEWMEMDRLDKAAHDLWIGENCARCSHHDDVTRLEDEGLYCLKFKLGTEPFGPEPCRLFSLKGRMAPFEPEPELN